MHATLEGWCTIVRDVSNYRQYLVGRQETCIGLDVSIIITFMRAENVILETGIVSEIVALARYRQTGAG